MKKLTLGFALATLISACTKPVTQLASNNTKTATLSSSTITIDPIQWTNSSSGGPSYADITVDSITQNVISNGTVQVFQEGQSSTQWLALPYATSTGTVSTYYDYYYSPGTVRVLVQNSNGSTPSFPLPMTFRVVVIHQNP